MYTNAKSLFGELDGKDEPISTVGLRKKRIRNRSWQIPFLEALAQSGNVRTACLASGTSRSNVYQLRRRDKCFAKAWRHAEQAFGDLLLSAAKRRAIDGVEEPVFWKGKQIGTVRKYSDSLLRDMLRAHVPVLYASKVENIPTNAEDRALPVNIEQAICKIYGSKPSDKIEKVSEMALGPK